MKKKIVSIALIIALAMSLCLPASAAGTRTVKADITYRGISIIVNGTEITPCDEAGRPTEPFIMNSTTYLPVRAIANALGLGVDWISATSTIALTSGGEVNYGSGVPAASKATKTVDITYRGTNISLDGKAVALVNANGEAVEPFILDGTNYLPLRIVGEALGLGVQWDAATSTVTLSKKAAEKGYWLVGKQSSTVSAEGIYSNETTKYTYDSLGQMTSESYSNSDGDNYEYILTYHDGGAVATESYSDSTGDSWYNTYYENGLIATEGTAWYKTEYEYTSKGELTRIFTLYESGDTVTEEYKYDEYGRQIWYKNTCTMPGEPDFWQMSEYTWEDNVCYENTTDSDGNNMNLMYTYTYDHRGFAVKEEFGSIEDGVYLLNSTKEYEYLDDGTLLYEKTKYSNGSETEELYEYNSEGLITRYYSKRVNSSSEYLFSYDAQGRLVEESFVNSKGEYYLYQYKYDDRGNLTESYIEENGSYILTAINYDSKGTITEITVDTNGAELVYTCTNDKNGNLVRAEAELEGVKSIIEYEYIFIAE